MLARKYTLVHREDYEIVEVECAGLEYAHYLESAQRLAREAHRGS